jgi:hypothetical protein
MKEPIPQSPIIDAHSHLSGEHAFTGPICEPRVYLEHALTEGVGGVIAMSVPSPLIALPDGGRFFPAAWATDPKVAMADLRSRDFSYQGVTMTGDGQRSIGPARANPYIEGNQDLLRACDWVNAQGQGLTAYGAIIHHPILDDPRIALEQLDDKRAVALKIHTSTTVSEPEHISPTIIKGLIERNKPIIIHTDMLRPDVVPANPLDAIHRVLDPMKWANWAKANPDLKILFAHGMKLHTEAIRTIQQFCPNAAVGISPGLLINWEPGIDKLHHDPKVDFEYDLLEMFKDHPEQIMFDIDYAWNRIPPYPANRAQFNDISGQDWHSVERILGKMHRLGYSQDAVNQFFYANAQRLFNLG